MSSFAQIPTFVRNPQTGIISVSEQKDYIKPFELPVTNPNEVVTMAALQEVGPFTLTARHDGPLEIFFVKAVVYDTNDVPLTNYDIDWFLEHPGKRKQFMNRFVPLIATAGDAGRPYVLPETIFLPAVQSLNVTFRNNDNAVRKVELVLGCIKYYANAAPVDQRDKIWKYAQRRESTYTFFQTTDAAVALTALQTGLDARITVPDDTDLEIFKLSAQSTAAFRAQLRDGQNARAVTGARIHSSLLFGGHVATAMGGGVAGSGGNFPARWPTSFLVRRSTQLNMIFNELGNVANTVKVVMAGRRISYSGK